VDNRVTDIQVVGRVDERGEEILTPDALAFVEELQRRFGRRRDELLRRRRGRREEMSRAATADFLPETREVRTSEMDRGFSTGRSGRSTSRDHRTPEPKMAINALNSGARVWLADLEDANTPHWMNVISSQVALADAVRRRLTFESPEGKPYRLNKGRLATVVVRPRGWHLDERHILVDGKPTVGAFVDFGLYFFHNARELQDRGSGCTSICRKPRATSRRGCGMTCSAPPKSSSASQWDHSGHCAHRDDPGRL
jgi:malate synthase